MDGLGSPAGDVPVGYGELPVDRRHPEVYY